MKNIIFLAVMISLFAVFIISCGGKDNSKPDGSLGGDCFSNGTCNIGLKCHLITNYCYREMTWSEISSEGMDWDSAVRYCEDLEESDYSNWRLPTISELRTIIQNCIETEIGGECGITDYCLSQKHCGGYSCMGCVGDDSSVFGDTKTLWSSSLPSDTPDSVFPVDFHGGRVQNLTKWNDLYVRCVR